MRRVVIAVTALALVATGCIGGGSNARTVLVDFSNDQFAGSFLHYFPNRVEARPGDTVVFRQTWTGEPHSVTMGHLVDEWGKILKPYLKIVAEKGEEALPKEEPKEIEKLDQQIRWMSDDNGTIQQNGAQPCFLHDGLPPKKAQKPCAKAEQRQPAFDGTYNWYNSGFIPYQGSGSNTFTVKIAKNAKPGEHFFFCNYHGPFMSGWLDVKPSGAKIASQATISREARHEIDTVSRPLLKEFRKAQRGTVEPPKQAVGDLQRLGFIRRVNGKRYFRGDLAGLGSEDKAAQEAFIDEFIPRRLHVKAGKKITWIVLGGHTISFNVPKYFPIIRVAKSGKVSLNPKIVPPAGGAPDISKLGETHHNGPPKVNAGKWDGKGFWSSGFIESFEVPFVAYSLRITRPGTYRFACLVHPPMVGTVTVTR